MAFRCQRPTWDEEARNALSWLLRSFRAHERGQAIVTAGDQATKMTSRNIALRRRNAATDIPFENSFPLEKSSKLAKYRKSHCAALPQFPNHHAVRFVGRKSHTSSWEISEDCKNFG